MVVVNQHQAAVVKLQHQHQAVVAKLHQLAIHAHVHTCLLSFSANCTALVHAATLLQAAVVKLQHQHQAVVAKLHQLAMHVQLLVITNYLVA